MVQNLPFFARWESWWCPPSFLLCIHTVLGLYFAIILHDVEKHEPRYIKPWCWSKISKKKFQLLEKPYYFNLKEEENHEICKKKRKIWMEHNALENITYFTFFFVSKRIGLDFSKLSKNFDLCFFLLVSYEHWTIVNDG